MDDEEPTIEELFEGGRQIDEALRLAAPRRSPVRA